MCIQTLYSLQACIITVLVGLIDRYLQSSTFCVRISGTPTQYLFFWLFFSFFEELVLKVESYTNF